MKWNKDKDILALMTGHGRSLDGSWDPGCTYKGYTEADLMQGITKEAVKNLRSSGVIVMTDSDQNNNMNVIAGTNWANNEYASLFISMHCDWSEAPAGIYPLYVSNKGKKMAVNMGKAVAKAMGMKYRGSAKRTDLYELNQTNMPAMIFEAGAIKADLKYLKSKNTYGRAFAMAVCEYLGVPFTAFDSYTKAADIKLPDKGYFKSGDSGLGVRALQSWLKGHGYDPGTIDGKYGKNTMAAVKKFQKKVGLKADGLFGKQSLLTAKKIEKS